MVLNRKHFHWPTEQWAFRHVCLLFPPSPSSCTTPYNLPPTLSSYNTHNCTSDIHNPAPSVTESQRWKKQASHKETRGTERSRACRLPPLSSFVVHYFFPISSVIAEQPAFEGLACIIEETQEDWNGTDGWRRIKAGFARFEDVFIRAPAAVRKWLFNMLLKRRENYYFMRYCRRSLLRLTVVALEVRYDMKIWISIMHSFFSMYQLLYMGSWQKYCKCVLRCDSKNVKKLIMR